MMKNLYSIVILLFIFKGNILLALDFAVEKNLGYSQLGAPLVNRVKEQPAVIDYLRESFEGDFPPPGWLVISDGSSAQQWTQTSRTSHNGSFSAVVSYSQQNETMDEWLITSAVDLSNAQSASLIFWEDQSYWDEGVEHSVRISTSFQTEKDSFTTILKMTPQDHTINGFDGEAVEINLSDYVGQSTVYIAFHYTGTYADVWYIDDVMVVQPDQHDVKAVNLIMDNHYDPGYRTLLQGVVQNVGLEPETFDVHFGHLDWFGNPVIEKTRTVTDLEPGARKNVNFGFFSMPENVQYKYFLLTELPSDLDGRNDMIVKIADSFTSPREIVLVEKATGTWCGYCPGSALAVDSLGRAFPGQLAVLEYHGSDEYENESGRARINFYGITGYPTAVFNGSNVLVGGSSATQWEDVFVRYRTTFYNSITRPKLFDINLTYIEENGHVNAKAEITSLALSYLSSYRVFYAISESHIYERWGDLDSLQHVARGFFPSIEGNQFIKDQHPDEGIQFVDEQQFDFPEGVVKENCQIIAFIQNMETLDVMGVAFGQQVDPGPKFVVTINDSMGMGKTEEEIAIGGTIYNLTDSDLDISVNRTKNDIPNDWTSAICLDVCLAPFVDRAEATIAAFDSLEFSIHFFSGPKPDSGSVEMEITDTSDSFLFVQDFMAKTDWPAGVNQKETTVVNFELYDSYPNPFNPGCTITYSVAEVCFSIKLQVFSILGQMVVEQDLNGITPGLFTHHFNGRNNMDSPLAAGIYLYRIVYLTQKGRVTSDYKKFTLMK